MATEKNKTTKGKKRHKERTEEKGEKRKSEIKQGTISKKYNPWEIIRYAHMTEKSINMVERENKMVFIVKRDVKREDVKRAVEMAFKVKVKSVNIENTHKGEKKAYVKLRPEFKAIDIATKMGMI